MAKKNTSSPQTIKAEQTNTTTIPAPKTGISLSKQLLLTVVASVSLLIISALPRHTVVLERIKEYYKEAKKYGNIPENELIAARHGENYAVPIEVEKMMKPNDIFLLPPKDYIIYTQKMRKQPPNPNNWSNPYVFYYFSDKVKTCPYNNDSLNKKATLALRFDEKVKNWGVIPIKNDTILKLLLEDYKKK